MTDITLIPKLDSSSTDVVPESYAVWYEWLVAQEQKTCQVYSLKPEQIIADYRRENAITRDYEGREILELLQNAADAAQELNVPGMVRIELYKNGLIVANTGKPFSVGGIMSLQTSDLSPKRHKRRSNIGNKGLGFRAVMNWSRQPLILSGSLRIAYSLDEAERKLTRLAQESVGVAEVLRIETEGKKKGICPLLPFPAFSADGDLTTLVHADAVPILDRCTTLLDDGYATVIGMPFDRVEAFEHALSQIDELQPEFLLFSLALTDISIGGDTIESRHWSRQQIDEDSVRLAVEIHNQLSVTEWILFPNKGVVPADLLRDERDPDRYEIVVALPRTGAGKPGLLHSHFPTAIPLPLPVLCHVTLELEQNRKRAQQIESNGYILQCLADHLAEIAERIASSGGEKWRGLDLLKARRDFPSDLSSFEKRLIESVQKKRIVPSLSGELIRPADALLITGASSDWLPPFAFADIAAVRDANDLVLYKKLGIGTLDAREFVRRVNSLSSLSIDQRCDLIVGVIRNHLPSDFHSPSLLLDTAGLPVSKDDRVFLPSESVNSEFPFPSWARVRILNGDMWNRINVALDAGRIRETRRLLESFGVQEYALAPLVSGLALSCTRACEADSVSSDRIRTELLNLLFALFPAEQPREKRPVFPALVAVKFRNQDNQWADANSLYLGTGYPPSGETVQELYRVVPTKLAARPEHSGIHGDVCAIREFLLWLGAAEWPREIEIKQVSRDFLAYTLQRIRYPAVFGDSLYNRQGDVENPAYEKIVTLDNIDILLGASSEAILAWLAKDSRADSWRHWSPTHGKLTCRPWRTQNSRIYHGPLPSFIHWKIKTTGWLDSTTGQRLPPEQCMLGDRSIEGIFPRPHRPAQAELTRLGLEGPDLHISWLRAGVPPGLSHLESEDIYSLLYELGEKQVDGKVAKRLYRWLLESSDLVPESSGHHYTRFVTKGKIWARHGEKEGYFPVSQTLHVDIEGLPPSLLENLPIADLPKKRGPGKVALLLGLRCIDRASVEESVEHHVSAPIAAVADANFQAAKPYLLALRQSQTVQPQQLDLLRRLRLEVSTEVISVVRYAGQAVHHQIRPWYFAIDGDSLYVSCDPSKPTDVSPSLLADVIGAAVASIFGLTDGSPFAQLFQCGDTDRRSLLARLLGEEHEADVDSLLRAAGGSAATESPVIYLPTNAISTGLMGNMHAQQEAPVIKNEASGGTTLDPESEVGAQTQLWRTPTAITVEAAPHVQQPLGSHIDIKVGNSGSTGNGLSALTQKSNPGRADGEVGEVLAVMFEQNAGRYPIRVGHITGYLAPGCDILSFKTQHAREQFLASEIKDATLVDRFIEAKARSGGSVELTGHELNAARMWTKRYFIYRFERDASVDEGYVLTTLCDPLSATEAQTPVIHFSLGRAASAERFLIRKDSAQIVP